MSKNKKAEATPPGNRLRPRQAAGHGISGVCDHATEAVGKSADLAASWNQNQTSERLPFVCSLNPKP